MRYRRKPTEVEAEQFTGRGDDPRGVRRDQNRRPFVVTMHGQQVFVEPGDWILKEPAGSLAYHFYPVRDSIFRETYEPVLVDTGNSDINPLRRGMTQEQVTGLVEMMRAHEQLIGTEESGDS